MNGQGKSQESCQCLSTCQPIFTPRAPLH
jgi:hypothetical protein